MAALSLVHAGAFLFPHCLDFLNHSFFSMSKKKFLNFEITVILL